MTQGRLFEDPWASGAVMSPCGQYRYLLWRNWDRSRPRALFVMLNPSTGDAQRDDATIRRCRGYAQAWGFGGFDVTNLFAFRATRPSVLRDYPGDRVGAFADMYIGQQAQMASQVIVAWGGNGDRYVPRVLEVVGVLEQWTLRGALWCIGTTAGGQPVHPLMQEKTAERVPWNVSMLIGV